MEELLNKLIEKGWKPRNIECTGVKSTDYCLEFYTKAIGWISKYERHLVSKESGLWQFVCENKLQPTNKSGGWEYGDGYTVWTCMAYEYRLIESALKDESELEEFLLDNIKIDEDTK